MRTKINHLIRKAVQRYNLHALLVERAYVMNTLG